ncbi:molybdate-binding protein [Thiomicrorhabdus immobilis]|uniref:Molybdate-binding protein n=1 Tax=Thiomicrorhabdus immobilis TaxID=2791037 RepID=A0ABM7MAR6_9GAMM|nr:molybdate ABC transporter substrate-binding protein [Thiomicrorhabdus immobilis]BCN92428.1 molybdate-binding protein [Thiomicrorhabdus immobilis]
MRKYFLLLALLTSSLLSGCDTPENPTNNNTIDLTIYSGITMIRPLSVLAKEFEQQHSVKIDIKQGGSGFLYKTIKAEKKGDIFFPGTDSYRIKSLKQGETLLQEKVFVGYNRIALVVAKGNPKHLTNDLKQLTNPQYSVVLSSPESGAVGKNAKAILDKAGLTKAVYDNATYFTTDSHRIFRAIKEQDADVALNWYATTKWPETADFMDAILLPESIAKPQKLEMSLLSYSKKPNLTIQFMNFASSKHGLEVFAEYGFLTDEELQIALKNITPIAERVQ